MASIGDIVAYLRMDSKNFTKNARAASTQTKGLTTGFGRMAKSAGKGALALAGVGGATAVVSKMFSNARGFDRALTRSVAIQGASVEQSERMRKAALEVSKTTQFSAQEAAESFYFLASAGLTVEEQLDSIGTVARFAQAGAFDMATATDLLTDAQSAMGMSAGSAAEKLANLKLMGDTLVAAETLANASTMQFSEAMTNGAAVAARTYGVSLAETVATLAVFADQGAKGSEAGTKFAIVLRDLTTKSIKQKEAFQAAGVEIFDQQGKFLGISNAIKELTERLRGLSDAQAKTALMELGFSDKSVGAIQMLIGTTDQLQSFIDTLGNVGGTMNRVAGESVTELDKTMGALNEQFERFSQFVVTPAIKHVLTPAVKGASTFAEDVASDVSNKTTGQILLDTINPMEGYRYFMNKVIGYQTPKQMAFQPNQSFEEMEAIKEEHRARRQFTMQKIQEAAVAKPGPVGSSLPALGAVFRSGVKPIGGDGASTADPTSSAMLETLQQQLDELKKLNSDTETI